MTHGNTKARAARIRARKANATPQGRLLQDARNDFLERWKTFMNQSDGAGTASGVEMCNGAASMEFPSHEALKQYVNAHPGLVPLLFFPKEPLLHARKSGNAAPVGRSKAH